MRTVTALRAHGRGRVAVELDGVPWRTLPLEPVLRAGLAAGEPLDRARARALARELRRGRALATAGRALRRRDHSARSLDERLARAGVAPGERRATVETLLRVGLVDDARFAAGRAAALAARGYGDAAIRWDLERRGVATGAIEDAIGELEPEAERARAVGARRGGGPATARFLSRRGFADDSVEAALRSAGANDEPPVG